jgi:hypothetical protein
MAEHTKVKERGFSFTFISAAQAANLEVKERWLPSHSDLPRRAANLEVKEQGFSFTFSFTAQGSKFRGEGSRVFLHIQICSAGRLIWR